VLVQGSVEPCHVAVLEPDEGDSVRISFLLSRQIGEKRETHQFSVSGLIVLSFPLCFAQVLQLAFSSLTPFAISFLRFVMTFQLDQTSSSVQLWER
jgi:hypothetical protein